MNPPLIEKIAVGGGLSTIQTIIDLRRRGFSVNRTMSDTAEFFVTSIRKRIEGLTITEKKPLHDAVFHAYYRTKNVWFDISWDNIMAEVFLNDPDIYELVVEAALFKLPTENI